MQDRVKGPAIALIVLGSLGVLCCFASLFFDALYAWVLRTFAHEHRPDEVVQRMHVLGLVFDWAMLILCFFGCTFVIWAGVQMMNMRHHTVAIIAPVLVMIPCGSSWCCCIGIPIGIWSLLTLTKPEVKAAFTG